MQTIKAVIIKQKISFTSKTKKYQMVKLIKHIISKQYFVPTAPLVFGSGMYLKRILNVFTLNQSQLLKTIHFDQHKNSLSWVREQLKDFELSKSKLPNVQILKISHTFTLELCCLALPDECFSGTDILVVDVTANNQVST